MTQNQDLPLPVGHYLTLHNGLRLHYTDEGQGPRSAVAAWQRPRRQRLQQLQGQLPVLAEAGYRNIVLDLPGFGRSDKPDTGMYDTEFFVATLRAFTQALDITRCTLLGNSLGRHRAGPALAEPELAEKLILLAPGGVEERETYFRCRASSAWSRCSAPGLSACRKCAA